MKKKNEVLSGLTWSFLERICAQGVSFVVSVVLARILMPEDYGVIAIVQIFITFANAITTTGLDAAVIQKKDITEEDYASAFILNMLLGIILYGVIYFTAPFIAAAYHTETITSVLRVLGIRIPISAFNAMQRAYVSRHLQFKKFFFSTLGGTIASAFVGIIMAMLGYGCWALVFQYLTNCIIDTVTLFLTISWRPSLHGSIQSMKSMLSFGWKILCGSLISEIYLELRSLVIGFKYSSEDLAYYKRGQQFPALFLTNITSALGSVMFPSLAKDQDNIVLLKERTRKSLRCCLFIMVPLMYGMAGIAMPLVSLLLTNKWLPCVPYLMMYSIAYSILPMQTLSEQAYKALGLGDVMLRTQIISKAIGIIFILINLPFGVFQIGIGMVASTYLTVFVYIYTNKKYLNYSVSEQLTDIIPIFILSISMFVVIWNLKMIVSNTFLLLVFQIIVGILIYLIGSVVFKIPAINDFENMIIQYIRTRKHE